MKNVGKALAVLMALLLLAGCSGSGSSSSQAQTATVAPQSVSQSEPEPVSSEPEVVLPPTYGIYMDEPDEFVRETETDTIAFSEDGSYINMDDMESSDEFDQQFDAYTKDAYQTGMTEAYQTAEGGDKDASVVVTNLEFYDQQGYPALRVDYKVLMNNTTSFGTQIIVNADRVYVITLVDGTIDNAWGGAFEDSIASIEVITDENSELLNGAGVPDASTENPDESQAA